MKSITTSLIHENSLENYKNAGSKNLLNKILSREDFLLIEKDFYTITKDKIQKSIFVKDVHIFDSLIKPILLSAAMESENISAGSADITLLFSLFLIKRISKIKNYSIDKKHFFHIISEAVQDKSSYFHESDFNKIVNQSTKSLQTRKVIKEAIKLAGSKNKIFVEKSSRQETIIQFQKGYYFNREIENESICFFDSSGTWSNKNCNIFIIDGDVLTVSDIHYLLESASENKIPHVLIARSFSPDVFNTLHVNKARGTINIIPIAIPFEQDTANILVDIATACGTDIVSPLKGDLISKACKNDLAYVKEIEINRKGITVVNPLADRRCKSLLEDLKNRIRQQEHDEIKEILSMRISSLSGSKVKIQVGQNLLKKSQTAVEDIDKILRKISTMSRAGTIRCGDISREIRNKDLNPEILAFCDVFSSLPSSLILPSSSILIAAKKGLSSFENVKNISHGLLVDNNSLL